MMKKIELYQDLCRNLEDRLISATEMRALEHCQELGFGLEKVLWWVLRHEIEGKVKESLR